MNDEVLNEIKNKSLQKGLSEEIRRRLWSARQCLDDAGKELFADFSNKIIEAKELIDEAAQLWEEKNKI